MITTKAAQISRFIDTSALESATPKGASSSGVEDRFDAAVTAGRKRMVHYAIGGGMLGTLFLGPVGTLLGAATFGTLGALTGALSGFVHPTNKE